MRQQALATAADQPFEDYRKPTRRDERLKAMVSRSGLCDVIERHFAVACPRSGDERDIQVPR